MSTRKRPDIAKKRQEQKTLDETIVKCSLKGCLLGEDKKNIVTAIRNRVDSCSHRYVRASIAMNFIVRQLIDGEDDLSSVTFPEFWDPTFVRQLMLGTESAHKKDLTVEQLYNDYPNLLSRKERHIGDRNIYSFAATKLATNIKNHLRFNLEKLLKKYFYNVSGLSKDQASEAIKTLFKWIVKDSEDPKVIEHVSKIRDILDSTYVSKMLLKSEAKLPNLLRLFVYINRELEQKNQKMYNLLPLCKVKSHFITIDTSVFQGILKEIGIIDKDKEGILDSELWESVFDVQKVKGKDKVFTRTIDSDGCVANIHFRKPKKSEQQTEVSLIGKRVLGVDPGRTNIFTIVEEIETDRFKKFTLTRRHYYNASGINIAKEKSSHWNKPLKEEIKLLSENSPKSPSLEKFQSYLQAFFSVENSLWKEYTKKRWQEQRFRLYGGKKRVFSNFFNRLGENVVLAYGSAKLAPGGRNEVSVPVGRAYKEATYRFPTIPIDEFRTSKINWKDHSVLEKVMKPGKNKQVDVRGLLWCRSTIESKSKFVDRDLNAAINILHCATLPRPTILKRSLAKGKLEQPIGKIIRC